MAFIFSPPHPKNQTAKIVTQTPPKSGDSSTPSGAQAAAEWRTKVEQELKGADFERALVRETIDGMPLQPVYSSCEEEQCQQSFAGCVDEGAESLPGQSPFIRGRQPASGERSWKVTVEVNLADADANAKLLEDLQNGADGIWLQATSIDQVQNLEAALKGVQADACNWILTANSAPTATGTYDEQIGDALEQAFNQWLSKNGVDRSQCSVSVPKQCVNMLPYHMAGATEAQELSIALSKMVEHLRLMEEQGVDLDEFAEFFVLRFAVARDTFLEIAKLRAARGLSEQIMKACDLRNAPVPLLHVVTSPRTLARRDPWVNMLRSTTQCFAAILGGADAITTLPFDSLSGPASDLGRRVARNTQLILDEECHLGSVADAAGGAYALENYTQMLAERGWAGFQEIEKLGGLSAVLASGWLADWLQQSHGERRTRIRKRKMPITGVSEYANLSEELPESMQNPDAGFASFRGLPQFRDAEEFEALRDWADAWTLDHGSAPTVFVLTLGDAAKFGPRLDFVRNFFAAGGWQTVVGDKVQDFTASGAVAACLCGLDDSYEEQGELAAPQLMMSGAQRIFRAGKGVDGIFVGCDVWQTLSDLKDLYQKAASNSEVK